MVKSVSGQSAGRIKFSRAKSTYRRLRATSSLGSPSAPTSTSTRDPPRAHSGSEVPLSDPPPQRGDGPTVVVAGTRPAAISACSARREGIGAWPPRAGLERVDSILRAMKFELPDGTLLDLGSAPLAPTPRPRSGRGWRAPRSRSRSTVSSAIWTRRCRSRPAGRRSSSHHRPQRRRGARLIRHDAAHVLAAAVIELYPGVKVSIGPPIEERLLLRLRLPRRRGAVRGRPSARSRQRMPEHIRADERFVREEVAGRRTRASGSSRRTRTTRSS